MAHFSDFQLATNMYVLSILNAYRKIHIPGAK